MYWTPAEHITQLCCMAVIIFAAQAIGRRAQKMRHRAETDRLRSILILGLVSLLKTYRDNLELLPHRPRRLVSGRQQMALLRIHLGRLTHLETVEVEAMMAACIAAECLEAQLDGMGRQLRDTAASIPGRNELKASFKAATVDAIDKIEGAINALDPAGEVRRRTQAGVGREVSTEAQSTAPGRIASTAELRSIAPDQDRPQASGPSTENLLR